MSKPTTCLGASILPVDGETFYLPQFLDNSDTTMQKIIEETDWEHRTIKLFGKKVLQPRLTCWMADKDTSYKYSQTTFLPTPWTKTMSALRKRVSRFLNQNYNSALLNLYRDQQDSMGLHCDNERELGTFPCIASLSFGATRQIIFRHKSSKEKVSFMLEAGSLLVMSGSTQDSWKHEVPKQRTQIGPRLNATFRTIYNNQNH